MGSEGPRAPSCLASRLRSTQWFLLGRVNTGLGRISPGEKKKVVRFSGKAVYSGAKRDNKIYTRKSMVRASSGAIAQTLEKGGPLPRGRGQGVVEAFCDIRQNGALCGK